MLSVRPLPTGRPPRSTSTAFHTSAAYVFTAATAVAWCATSRVAPPCPSGRCHRASPSRHAGGARCASNGNARESTLSTLNLILQHARSSSVCKDQPSHVDAGIASCWEASARRRPAMWQQRVDLAKAVYGQPREHVLEETSRKPLSAGMMGGSSRGDDGGMAQDEAVQQRRNQKLVPVTFQCVTCALSTGADDDFSLSLERGDRSERGAEAGRLSMQPWVGSAQPFPRLLTSGLINMHKASWGTGIG